MLIHEIKINHPRKYKKTRVGRGGKRGTTAGHGTKGQKSRAGHRIRPAGRDLIQRLPKLRGSSNLAKSQKLPVINVGDLDKIIKGEVVSAKTIGGVKILGGGDVKRAFTIEGLRLSKSAKQKIESAGGKIILHSQKDE